MAEKDPITTLSELSSSEHFQRVMTLHCDCGADAIRKRIEKELDCQQIDLKKHITNNKKKLNDLYRDDIINKDQWDILTNDQKLTSMDISLLTMLLLKTFNLPRKEKAKIEKLRSLRNKMAHIVKGALDDKTVFVKTSNLILDIAKDVSNDYYNLVKDSVAELEKRKLVLRCSTHELVLLNSEDLMVKVTDNRDKSQNVTDWIRFGLTKWVHQIARGVEMGRLLLDLNQSEILRSEDTLKIQQVHDYEEQANMLVLQLIHANEEVILRFCKLLRSYNPHICDLIENNASDGRDTEKVLKEIETKKIEGILKDGIQQEIGQYIASEDLHVFVEKKLGWRVQFSIIEECIYNKFPTDRLKSEENRLHGFKWKEDEDTIEELHQTEDPNSNLDPLTCEQFSVYAEKESEKVQPGVGQMLKDAIIVERISSQIFSEMTETELKSEFGRYIQYYSFGIRKFLTNLQTRFKSCKTTCEKGNQSLRQFDSPANDVVYSKCNICPSTGNLLVPVHHFVGMKGNKLNIYKLVDDVLQFADACINVRQNGTIHFGMMPKGKGSAEIVGIKNKANVDCAYIDDQISKGINACFRKKDVHVIQRCVRPVQRVSIDETTSVFEVDIVPFSAHTGTDMFEMYFPSYGIQRQVYFVYQLMEILPVQQNQLELLEPYRSNIDDRRNLEQKILKAKAHHVSLEETLVDSLTVGNDYITDELVPVICCGKILGCRVDNHVRKCISTMGTAFLSSQYVLDFDSSVALRHDIEQENSSFRVKTAEDFMLLKENEQVLDENIWIYCNGNDELEIDPVEGKDWYNERLNCIRCAVENIREHIPKKRALIMFFVFNPLEKNEPMYEIARDCLISRFKDECVVISDREKNIKTLKTDISDLLGDNVGRYFHSGLTWDRIAELVKTVCRVNPDVAYKLPHSEGHFVEMTMKEKNECRFQNIELLSGVQCQAELEKMDQTEIQEKQNFEETTFYKGNPVSWWNFYFKNHVGERNEFRKNRKKIDAILEDNKGENIFETHEIIHRPGAGGSTLAMHLLWHYSQFDINGGPAKSYRCCVVRSISKKETIRELKQFRNFKDATPKPFILLIDNQPEEDVNFLKTKLNKLAYQTSLPGQLFCLLIIVNRVTMIQDAPRNGSILEHRLTKQESIWFRKKYLDLEKAHIDVDTLIAFNVMRHSFDKQFIEQTVQKVVNDVTEKEKVLLKHLSLINSFENDKVIPSSAFDLLMNTSESDSGKFKIGKHLAKVPFGIAHTMNQRKKLEPIQRLSWDNNTTTAFQLLITKRQSNEFPLNGICIISQLLARSILGYILQNEAISLEEAAKSVLDVVREHVEEKNEMSKHFVKVINSLFKTRQLLEGDKGEVAGKMKFSDLVLELDKIKDDETDQHAHDRVVTMMKACFKTTKDAMVGQQLARFNIHIKDFDAAETAIGNSLALKPKSSYLLDTYGQLNKAKMETLIETSCQAAAKISNQVASEIVTIAFKAIEKFRQGQEYARLESDEDTNLNCYIMEVKTLISLLEKWERFQCFKDNNSLLRYLNVDATDINVPEEFQQLRCGSPGQIHAEDSLRVGEERNYQVKRHLYTVYTESNEALLLKLRERFERFYGQTSATANYKFTYGIGLKALMNAYEIDNYKLEDRFREARRNLRNLKQANQRDLLVYIGYMVICLSSFENENPQEYDYEKLLQCSSKLVDIQISSRGRPYLEAFLYHAMFHWPTKHRNEKFTLCPPQSYEHYLTEWNKAYEKNFEIKYSRAFNKPKNYFALGNGCAGEDIVDLESIRKQWKKNKQESEGRTRQPVMKDNFWKEPFVAEKLARLEGVVDDSGRIITYKFKYETGTHAFKIKTYYDCEELSNRKVTFVLGFTWRNLTAFDVDQIGKSRMNDKSRTDSDIQQEIGERRASDGNGDITQSERHEDIRPLAKNSVSDTVEQKVKK